jgi:hypothetical protein
MALFTSYAPPGVYTFEIFNAQASAALGSARIPVVIGEGTQFFSFNNVELYRGSSAVQDDQAVNENLSNQIGGFTRTFQTTYFPVTDGAGRGVVTNDPSKVQAEAIDTFGNILPVTVISLVGATGVFNTQDIIPVGWTLSVTYNFKRGDTLVTNEDASKQIPTTATLTVAPGALSSPPTTSNSVKLSLSNPGAVGNLVTLQFVSGPAVPDAQAVAGAGTDQIVININSPVSTNAPAGVRTLTGLYNLVQAGIPTLDGGFLTAGLPAGAGSTVLTVSGWHATIVASPPLSTSPPTSGAIAFGTAPDVAGTGGGSNTVFQVQNFPITDGLNGGTVTTNPANVTAQVNGASAAVSAVNGQTGLVTLATPVASSATLTFTYYYNTWQNTFDLLPASNVASVVSVGLGPGRNDFLQNVDYSLGVDAAGNGIINWGNSASTAIGVSAAGENASFTPSEVTTSVVDEQVWLRPVSGVVNNKNTVFGLSDTPTDGSGLGRPTDNPALVQVYVGSDPIEAFLAGAVRVAGVSGVAQQVTLYNPPAPGNNVYASYYRNTLGTHQYSVQVVTPGYGGLGTFLIKDELGRVIPLVTHASSSVAASGPFAATGVVYPNARRDYQAQVGAAVNENVTLTFNTDGTVSTVPAVPATLALVQGSGTLTFWATIPGTGGNNVKIAINATDANAEPIVVNGNLVTIYSNWAGTSLTLAQVANLFPSAETLVSGQIICVASGTTSGLALVTAATPLAGGANSTLAPVTQSYTVTSSNSKGSGSGGVGNNIGYLDQTYEDVVTGFRITVVNPSEHVGYGVLTLPGASYNFAPGDTLVYSVKVDSTGANAAVRNCGIPATAPAQANTFVAIQGMTTQVISNYNSTAGDTVVVSTSRGSGSGPAVGTYYYVNFTSNKTAADMALKIFTNPQDAFNQYGQPSTVNRLSLGIQLLTQNGAQTFGAIQVPVQPGTNFASSADYIAALQQCTKNLPGFNAKANVIVPLSSDPVVHQALSRQLTTQAGPRYKGEAIGFVGYSQYTTAPQAIANAVSLNNMRMVAVGNPAAGILITNLTTGVSVEYPANGPFMACALAGLNCNPANDVATTMTEQNIVGFSRLLITYDDPTMDLMAGQGLTLLLNNNGSLLVRHAKSTNPSNDLTSELTSVTITDYVAQQFRLDLKQFIGRKLIDALVTDIMVVSHARLKSLVDNQIISGYENLAVTPNPNDPTEVDVSLTFKPIFSLLYAGVTFTVQTSL